MTVKNIKQGDKRMGTTSKKHYSFHSRGISILYDVPKSKMTRREMISHAKELNKEWNEPVNVLDDSTVLIHVIS